jgi:hypothetical protein
MGIRCKMTLENVYANAWGDRRQSFAASTTRLLRTTFRFLKPRRAGFAEYNIDNPAAAAQLVIGKQYYVDFTPVE